MEDNPEEVEETGEENFYFEQISVDKCYVVIPRNILSNTISSSFISVI